MNDVPLQNIPLRDIHLPEAIGWWPLAIGWWLLPVVIFLCVFAVYQFLKHKKQAERRAYRKMALKELQSIKSAFKDNENSVELIRAISALLRRIALSYLPREKIASLTGEQWIQQLNQLSSQHVFSHEIGNLLEKAPYMAQIQFESNELIQLCDEWIKLLPATRHSTESAS